MGHRGAGRSGGCVGFPALSRAGTSYRDAGRSSGTPPVFPGAAGQAQTRQTPPPLPAAAGQGQAEPAVQVDYDIPAPATRVGVFWGR